ncbi:ankyrin repeat-containing domain protein [Mycena sanguinolenta]|nr:ankyrin repeat-containing domain protein [Mycena sanguinolenta]
MPDSSTHRLKSIVVGAFRPRRSRSSGSQSVPSAATNIPSTVTLGAAVPFAASSHSTTSHETPLSSTPVAVTSSGSGTPAIEVEPTSAKTPLVDNLTLALEVTEKLATFAQKIPFIAPIAGVLSQILKTYKEVKDTDDKRDALLTRSTRIAQDLCATILRMEATNHVDLIGRLRPDIELARGGFQSNRLVDLAIQQNKIGATIDKVHEVVLEKKLEEWLRSPPDMRQKQHETQKLRQEGTGRWFLEGNAFVEWEDNPGLLWIQGASGTGKSVLSSSVIQKLIGDQQLFEDFNKSSAVAFFYFDFKAKDSNAVETALRRIVLQMSAQSPHPHRTLDKQYQLSRGQALPNYRELLRLLQELLRELGRTYIIFDALDECPETEFRRLMELISMLRRWNSSPLHFLITSQPRAGFTDELGEVPGVFLESKFTQPDIELFIASELRENRKMKTWASHADEILHRVVYKSNGMFRLAACLLLELSRCKRQNELNRTLETLPNDLFGIYNRFIESVRPEDLVYVTGILRWLAFSAQNFTLPEIADAIAFDFSDPTRYLYDPSVWEDHTNAIPEWLEGLATVRDHGDRKTVVLAHASVRNYVLSGTFAGKCGYDLNQGHSYAFIARSCMGCLLHFSDHPLDLKTLPDYSLARYAAVWWCHHLRRSRDQDRSTLACLAILLLEDRSKQYSALNNLRNLSCDANSAHSTSDQDSELSPSISPLRLCAEEGYIYGEDESALQAASGCGHTEIVRLLLGNGAEVNAIGGKRGTALQVACAEDHTDVVKLLLANGADVDAKGTFLGTALQAASWAGNREVVALLLTNGADINAWGRYFGSALQAASSHGNTEIARILLDNGAKVNQRGGNYGFALGAASVNGHTDLVRLLVAKGANVNIDSQDRLLFGTFTQPERLQLRDEAVRFLRAKGADVGAMDEYFGSAMHAASGNGHAEIVGFLLQNGADDEAALQIASNGGHIEVVRVLLQNGTDTNAQPDGLGSALEAASKKGHMEIVRLLLEHGAAPNGSGDNYGGALEGAARQGHLDIIRLLLENGADINAHCEPADFGTALHSASRAGHTEVVRFLLENGGDVGAHDEFLATPLHKACNMGYMGIIQLLLENGADVNGASSDGTPWQVARAARRGDARILDLLIQTGAIVNPESASPPGRLFSTARQVVASYAHRNRRKSIPDSCKKST